jgi:hypothetical protein
MAANGTGTSVALIDRLPRRDSREETAVSYRELWIRMVAVLGVAGFFLALAESDPLVVVITVACCYGVILLVLIGVDNCGPEEPVIDWWSMRWRAGLGACLCVGLPAASAVSASATLSLMLGLALTSPPLVASVRRIADRSRRWTDNAVPPARAGRRTGDTSPHEQVSRLLELGPTPRLIAAMDDATLCVAWQRSFRMLSAASTVGERVLVAHLRQLYLDELDRRHPTSLASWLRTHPAASSGPERFLPDL